ncbi:bacteriohemerythrin [Spirochaetota bacterium]
MDYLSWNEELNVGIGLFNDDHKNLIDFVNQLNHALQIGQAKETMGQVLVKLINYTDIHFKNEEKLMAKHAYPEYVKHKNEHDDLTEQVKDFYERYNSGKVAFSLELLNFLRDWLLNHIQCSDMKYKDFFSGRGEK